MLSALPLVGREEPLSCGWTGEHLWPCDDQGHNTFTHTMPSKYSNCYKQFNLRLDSDTVSVVLAMSSTID